MAESSNLERKLAVVFYADVAGYSRLTGADEEGTHLVLRASLDTISNAIESHRGRVLHYAGDAVLAEFASVLEALKCAVAVQTEFGVRNAPLPEEERLQFRIGINIGDVIVDRDELYGDGVNVVARLEALADPGGICISRSVHDQVRNKTDVEFESMGEQAVKNIAEPVYAYRVQFGQEGGENKTQAASKKTTKTLNWPGLAGGLAVLMVLAAGALWVQPWKPKVEPVAVDEMTPPRSDRPSIAVLPFINMSDDKEQEYFSDGMTEDLITDLAKISDLTVISRTSTSGYKGRKIDIREIGKALGVRYVIEGSVRKVGSQVRITAQLIDAATGGHLWAERYDGDLNDIFSLQDQVLEKIVASLALKLSEKERRRLATRGTDSVEAHDLYMRGLFQESAFSREGNRDAVRLYEQALAIDPDYALPYTRISNILQLNTRNGWSSDVRGDLAKAVELDEKAIALDPQNPYIHWSLGRSVARLRTPGTLERGIKALERAIELDPDFADAHAFLAVLYIGDGRAEDGLGSVETAMGLNPRYPFWYLFMRGMTRYVVEEYEPAIADFEAATERSPTALFIHFWLAASYAQVGRQDDAEWEVEELQSMGFEGTIATIVETQPIQDAGYLSLYTEGLRKAGIPEN